MIIESVLCARPGTRGLSDHTAGPRHASKHIRPELGDSGGNVSGGHVVERAHLQEGIGRAHGGVMRGHKLMSSDPTRRSC